MIQDNDDFDFDGKLASVKHELDSRIVDLTDEVNTLKNSLNSKLEDKISFKLFLLLIGLVLGNLGFQLAIFERLIGLQYTTDKSLIEFRIKIENALEKIDRFDRSRTR